jgi:hypothetical protein
MMSWYTRGTRPDRNLEAALFSGLYGFLDALAKRKPRPLLYAATRAVASASAMNKHRLADRAVANERNTQLSDVAADALNRLLDLPPRPILPPRSK